MDKQPRPRGELKASEVTVAGVRIPRPLVEVGPTKPQREGVRQLRVNVAFTQWCVYALSSLEGCFVLDLQPQLSDLIGRHVADALEILGNIDGLDCFLGPHKRTREVSWSIARRAAASSRPSRVSAARTLLGCSGWGRPGLARKTRPIGASTTQRFLGARVRLPDPSTFFTCRPAPWIGFSSRWRKSDS